MIQNIISISGVIVAVFLIISVLMQNRGSGMGAVFGGDSNVYKTKRGAEKFLYWGTIVLAFLFLALSLARLVF